MGKGMGRMAIGFVEGGIASRQEARAPMVERGAPDMGRGARFARTVGPLIDLEEQFPLIGGRWTKERTLAWCFKAGGTRQLGTHRMPPRSIALSRIFPQQSSMHPTRLAPLYRHPDQDTFAAFRAFRAPKTSNQGRKRMESPASFVATHVATVEPLL